MDQDNTIDEKEIKIEAYLEWIKVYCRNDFKDGVPKAIELAIDKMMEQDNISTKLAQNAGIKTKSIADMSITYQDVKSISGEEGIRPDIKALLDPYVIKKARFI